MSFRRVLPFAAAVAGLCATLVAAPAQAAWTFEDAPVAQAGYTDLRAPLTSFNAAGQQVPLGAWRDSAGHRHVSRVYLTFDLARYAGKQLNSAEIVIAEASAPDCSKRAIDVWRTSTITSTPTWVNAPARLSRAASTRLAGSCPATFSLDIAGTVRSSLAAGASRLTLELAVPRGLEHDLDHGRRLAATNPVRLLVGYNTPPALDSAPLFNNHRPCATSGSYLPGSVRLEAHGSDADASDLVTAEFQVWPVDTPAQIQTLSGVSAADIPSQSLVDGRTLAWRARVSDGQATSGWSANCYFTIDTSAPAEPTVSSPSYDPELGAFFGPSAIFTFGPNGSADVAGYQYSWSELATPGCDADGQGGYTCAPPAGYVPAEQLGASGTIEIVPPGDGSWTLKVRSFDRAGNPSATLSLDLYVVLAGPPGVSSTDYPEGSTPAGAVGLPGTFHLTPPTGVTVTGYAYSLGDLYGEVAASADGSADVLLTPTVAGGQTLTVAAVLGPDSYSFTRDYQFTVAG